MEPVPHPAEGVPATPANVNLLEVFGRGPGISACRVSPSQAASDLSQA